jgi:rod shape-determining protein MreC
MLRSKAKKIILAVAVLGLLIFLNYFHCFDWPKNLLINLFLPLQEKTTFLLTKFKSSKSSESTCNLKENLATVQLKLLEEENKQLRQTLNFFTTNNYLFKESKTVVANIIGRNPLTFSSILILDQGRSQGVHIGDAVILGEGIMIGRIIALEDNLSYFALLTNSQVKIAALILSDENLPGLVEGSHGLSLKMNLIPLDKKINIGDLVITSGLEKGIPKGLLIGQIEEINTQSNDLFQNITLQPAVNLSNLNIVTILKST